MLLTNLCSIANKVAELELMFEQHAAHMFVVTESWLCSGPKDAEIMLIKPHSFARTAIKSGEVVGS